MKKLLFISYLVMTIAPACLLSQTNQEKMAIEKELLQKAAQNIETHRKGQVEIEILSENSQPIHNAKIDINQTTHDFLFGAIIFDLVRPNNMDQDDINVFKYHFKELYNFAVLPFYWKSYEPQPGFPRGKDFIDTINWCQYNGITTKGHPLVWTHPAGTPKWILEMPYEESIQQLEVRVKNCVRGFSSKIDIWDVVNEPVQVMPWKQTHAHKKSDGRYGTTPPLDKIIEYVEPAYRWAHQANPDAKLILNEFNQIAVPEVRQRFYELAAELKKRKVPLHGLGIQAHEPREEWYSPVDVIETLNKYAELGYPLHITEFIPQSGGKDITGPWRTRKWNLQTQTEFAEQMYRLAFGHPAVDSINWWGFTDRNIWLEGGGLLDKEFKPKPVYHMLKKLIHQEWKTNLSGITTNQKGAANFKGFYGKYNLTITLPDGKKIQKSFHLQKDKTNKWQIKI